ncbi:MAG: hypothetical protein P9L91_10130 [Candidatus Zophobacter franzmannii]|nr:hypothetical protein [Candidatus Zophobacter franzmannii]
MKIELIEIEDKPFVIEEYVGLWEYTDLMDDYIYSYPNTSVVSIDG